MTTKEMSSLGLKLNFNVPSSVDEFDANAKKVGACLTEAINNVLYRGSLAIFRNTFLHGREAVAAADGNPAVEGITGVEQQTGIERQTEPVMKDGKQVQKDGEGVVSFSESEGKYFARVCSQLVKDGKFPDEDTAVSSFQPLADQVVASIPFDASASEPKTGPKQLPAKYKIAAAQVLSTGVLDKLNAILQSTINKVFTASNDQSKVYTGSYPKNVGGVETQVQFSVSEKDALDLGKLLKERADWKAAQEAKEFAEALV